MLRCDPRSHAFHRIEIPPPVLTCALYSNNPYSVDYKFKRLVMRSLKLTGVDGRGELRFRIWPSQTDQMKFRTINARALEFDFGRMGVDLGDAPYFNFESIDVGAMCYVEIVYDIE